MATIRLYRRFYHIISDGVNESYNLIDPNYLSANVYIKDSATLVESISIITKESNGVYYVDLNPIFYTYSNTYDLKWLIQYLPNKSYKNLITSFRINPINISTQIDTDVTENEIEYIVDDIQTIEIEI